MLPLLLGSLLGGINLQLNEEDGPAILLDVGLVNQDDGMFGQQVAQALEDFEQLNVELFDAVAAAERQVAEGEIAAAIVIPADFTQKIDAHTPTAVEVFVDPAQPESASTAVASGSPTYMPSGNSNAIRVIAPQRASRSTFGFCPDTPAGGGLGRCG